MTDDRITTEAGEALAAFLGVPNHAGILAIEAEARAAALAAAAERVKKALPDPAYRIETMDGRLREMRTPADGAEAMRAAVLAILGALR